MHQYSALSSSRCVISLRPLRSHRCLPLIKITHSDSAPNLVQGTHGAVPGMLRVLEVVVPFCTDDGAAVGTACRGTRA
jgi:hypothetical protein